MKKMLGDGVIGGFKKGSKSKYTYIVYDEKSKSSLGIDVIDGVGKYVGIKDKVRTPGLSCGDDSYHISVNAKWESPKSKGYDNQVCYWDKKGTIDLAKNKVTTNVKTRTYYFGGKHKTTNESGVFTR